MVRKLEVSPNVLGELYPLTPGLSTRRSCFGGSILNFGFRLVKLYCTLLPLLLRYGEKNRDRR